MTPWLFVGTHAQNPRVRHGVRNMSVTGTSHAIPAQRQASAIVIIGVLFFVMGWFTWLNGPLISFVQLAFDLDVVNAFLVTFVSYLSYFVWALPASAILDRTGMKKGMAIALWVMAIGAFAFGQFCTQRWYPGALAGLFVIFADRKSTRL